MYSKILVPVDLDEPSSWEKAFPVAKAMAKAFGASMTMCSVVPDRIAMLEAQWSSLSYDALLDRAEARLGLLANDLGESELATKVGIGTIYAGIIDIASEIGADLIVLSSHRPAMKDWLIGANAARVVRHAPCSVLVVRDESQ